MSNGLIPTISKLQSFNFQRWIAEHPLPAIPERVTIFEHARLAGAGLLD